METNYREFPRTTRIQTSDAYSEFLQKRLTPLGRATLSIRLQQDTISGLLEDEDGDFEYDEEYKQFKGRVL